jgi:pimeloyl-ACP methyl ester carboxylesterase
MLRQLGQIAIAGAVLLLVAPIGATGQGDPLSVDHYVRVHSTAPSMEGEFAQLYVRERVLAATALRPLDLENRVVLFVHGAGTPAEVAFDPPGASWMEHLARAGFDVFSMDMTGYGRSTRPTVMNDPCNLSRAQQAEVVPALIPAPCDPSFALAPTTIASDWNDIDAVVEYLRALRGVERVHLIGWSLGGPRAGGYTAQHAEKVATVTLLSPAYGRNGASVPPATVPPGASMTKQSRTDFENLWNGQLGCPSQVEPAIRESVWGEMLASDPVGATWGSGVRRAPRTVTWGFNQTVVAALETPMLLFAPATDGQVSPQSVRAMYEDLGSDRKILVDLACASHNAMWETNRHLLFRASLEWLRSGTVNGTASGEVRLGY